MARGSRALTALTGALALTLGVSACGGGSGGGGTAAPQQSAAGGGSAPAGAAAGGECAPYSQYGQLQGKKVTIYTSIVTPEDEPQMDSYKKFEKCTGAEIDYQGDKAFETQVLVRAKAGNPPDIAIVPQPGLLKQLVDTGRTKPAPQGVSANVDKFWDQNWKGYGTVNGQFYAAPLGANLKSLVWYSPTEFQEKGYQVPNTLDELKALSDRMVVDGKKPWCAGIASGEATGWPITDWHEDFMLRLSGPEVYDRWVKHEIPFNGPESAAALDGVGSYLRNGQYVNGGLGDVRSIATATFQEAGLPILDGTCSLHRQASFYAANWPKGTKVAPDGDVFAFYLPSKDTATKPVLGGGEFILAFNDKPETQAFQTFLSSDTWANEKARVTPEGGWVSANKGLDANLLASPIDKLAASIFKDPKAVFRFDGSDQMPAAIGSNAYWKQATNWITGQSTQQTVDNIEKAWPKR